MTIHIINWEEKHNHLTFEKANSVNIYNLESYEDKKKSREADIVIFKGSLFFKVIRVDYQKFASPVHFPKHAIDVRFYGDYLVKWTDNYSFNKKFEKFYNDEVQNYHFEC